MKETLYILYDYKMLAIYTSIFFLSPFRNLLLCKNTSFEFYQTIITT